MRLLIGIMLLLMLIGFAGTVFAEPPENRPPETPPEQKILLDDFGDPIIIPSSRASSTGCDTAGAAIGVKAGGFSMSFPTYPCSIKRTYEAIDHTYELDELGEPKHGFWTGKVPRTFLRVRLVTKGLFSAIFGLIGLG